MCISVPISQTLLYKQRTTFWPRLEPFTHLRSIVLSFHSFTVSMEYKLCRLKLTGHVYVSICGGLDGRSTLSLDPDEYEALVLIRLWGCWGQWNLWLIQQWNLDSGYKCETARSQTQLRVVQHGKFYTECGEITVSGNSANKQTKCSRQIFIKTIVVSWWQAALTKWSGMLWQTHSVTWQPQGFGVHAWGKLWL